MSLKQRIRNKEAIKIASGVPFGCTQDEMAAGSQPRRLRAYRGRPSACGRGRIAAGGILQNGGGTRRWRATPD